MQAASCLRTGWNVDQMMNKTFEINVRFTTDKNETRISSSLFLHFMMQRIWLKQNFACLPSDHYLRATAEAVGIPY